MRAASPWNTARRGTGSATSGVSGAPWHPGSTEHAVLVCLLYMGPSRRPWNQDDGDMTGLGLNLVVAVGNPNSFAIDELERR